MFEVMKISLGDAYVCMMSQNYKQSLHTSAWKAYGVRKRCKQAEGYNTKYCQFGEAHRDYVYTQEWIGFLFNKLSVPDELKRVRNHKW